MTRRKHYDLILAWAEGKEIQYRCDSDEDWYDIQDVSPSWDEKIEYRIKPEPKPDIVGYTRADLKNQDFIYIDSRVIDFRADTDNLKLVFDGETGKLKSAEVLDV
jgi:hypothetical protein